MSGALDVLQHIGVQPHMLTPAMLGEGALEQRGIRLLILPRAIALSDAEVVAIRRFLAMGGKVLADGPTAAFDAHGRARKAPVLPGFPVIPADTALMTDVLRRAGVEPILRVTNQDGTPAAEVQVHSWRNGGVTMVGVQADYAAAGVQRQVVLRLPSPTTIQSVRGGGTTVTDTLPVLLDPVVPTLLVLAPAPLPKPMLVVATAGRTTRLVLTLSGASPAAVHIARVEMIRPDGAPSTAFNLPLTGTAVTPTVTFERDDPAGTWTVRMRDMLGSGVTEVRLNVPPP
jgi:hypothetical protein